MVVNLITGTASGAAGNDTLVGIEHVIGSEFDDVLIGNDLINVLYGAGGNDTFYAGNGDDFLWGLDGIDTAIYADASGSLVIDLSRGFATGASGWDILDVDNIVGSAFDDLIVGTFGANELFGGGGNDGISGGDGDDRVDGGAGADYLTGGIGDDIVTGGDGIDHANYYHTDTALGGVTVSLLLQGSAQLVGGQGSDTLTGIEYLIGTPFADVLTGDGNDNFLSGSAAYMFDGSVSTTNNDWLDGGGGNDLLTVGIGNHILIGGAGIDAVRVTEIAPGEAGLTISLLTQGTAQDTGNGTWTLNGIENLSGSSGADKLIGDDSANVLAGNVGNDTLIGNDGNDVLIGDGYIDLDSNLAISTFYDFAFGFGNDTLNGGRGDDVLYGGVGDDIMKGGPGSDRFVIQAYSGDDRVVDFTVSQDRIVFDAAAGPDDFSDLTFTKIHNDVLVTWGTGDSILLEGVRIGQLTASSFEFGSPATANAAQTTQSPTGDFRFGGLGDGFGGHYFEPGLDHRADYLLFA